MPDAFLRRCVFYHIPFPSADELTEIVQRKFKNFPDFTPGFIAAAVERFFDIRGMALKKKPATAEFLPWIRVLRSLNLDVKDIRSGQTEALAISFSLLAKSVGDLALLKKKIAGKT
jgi:MoxR-like ATPase